MASFHFSCGRQFETLARTSVCLKFVHDCCLTSLFLWGKYGDEIVAFHLGPVFHRPDLFQLFHQSLDQGSSNLFVDDFTTPEPDVGFDLVALIQETNDVVLLELVIVLVSVGPEFDFLDLDAMLLLLRFVLLLLLLVGELAVVHDFANGRASGRGHQNQVEANRLGLTNRVAGFEHLGDAVWKYYADLSNADKFVDVGFPGSTERSKRSSDSILLLVGYVFQSTNAAGSNPVTHRVQ